MSTVPVSSFLAEFDGEGAAVGGFVRQPSADTLARIEAAHASGVASGEAAAMALIEARLEEQRAAFARQLAAARQAWVGEEADKLAQCLAAGLDALQARVAEAAARVLQPFLRAELARQAIADLRAELELLATVEPGLAIKVAGPEDLVQALRDALVGRACEATYQPNGEVDVRITVGQTVLETRLAAWASKIGEMAG